MRTKVVKWGNSLGLRIPKSFAQEMEMTEGSAVDLTLEDGQLVIRLARQQELGLEELLTGITDSNIHTKIDTGDSVGGEVW